jgi:hypothetical protein
MLKKILITLAILLVIIAAGVVLSGYLMTRGPDLKAYLALKDPRIVEKPDQRMLVVEASGDPNVVGGKAFSLLFKTYFKVIKARGMAAPRARWPKPLETPKNQWTGLYALPVPAGSQLAQDLSLPGYRIFLDDWGYGQVAEILHIGPYSEEGPTVKRLVDHIAAQGYRIAGPHEEEYLRSGGMFGKGDPKKYYTIIRYQVEPIISLSDFNVALRFINDYNDLFSKHTARREINRWIESTELATDSFKSTYKNMVDSAEKADPEYGLGFDPILDAQDNPDKGFEILKADTITRYVTVQGKDWKVKLVLKIAYINNKWLVDGSGVINIPSDKRAK